MCDCYVIDEGAEGGPKTIASFETVKDAEDYIAELEKSQPDKVHRGGFGIDAPEEKVNS